jgi:hypothetical protein
MLASTQSISANQNDARARAPVDLGAMSEIAPATATPPRARAARAGDDGTCVAESPRGAAGATEVDMGSRAHWVFIAWAGLAATGCVASTESAGADDDEAAASADLDSNPDPEASPGDAAHKGHGCANHDRLSPSGFTLVVDLTYADDLHVMEPYLRDRDVLITGGSHTDDVHRRFPCNRLVTLLAGGDRNDVHGHGPHIGGLVLDIEPGYPHFSWSQSWVEGEAHHFVKKVHDVGRRAGLVPVYDPGWDYGRIAREANLDDQLVQNQASCKASGDAFAGSVEHVLGQYRAANVSTRSVAFEVSMRPGGDNAVSPGDAAWCAHLAWKKGAKAIFAYGMSGHASNWKGFFHGLDHVGLRRAH